MLHKPRRRASALGTVVAAAVLCLPSWATGESQGADELRRFSVDTWSVRDGLPSGRVRGVAQTPDGYLWVLTAGGLVRFDGLRFAPAPELQKALRRDAVLARALLVTRDGSLWVGGLEFLCRLKDGQATVYPTEIDASALAESADGSVWIGHEGHGLHRLTPNDGRLVDLHPRGLPPIRNLAEDGEGRLWVAGYGDAFYGVGDTGLLRHPASARLGDTHLNAVVASRDGSLFVASRAGLTKLTADGARQVGGLSGVEVTSLFENRRGMLWVGTATGSVHRLGNGQSEAVLAVAGRSDSGALCITEDREGSVWIGTADGLTRLRPGKFAVYTRRDGLAHDKAAGIIETRDGAVWVFSDGGGISRIDGAAITRWTEREGLASRYGGSLYEARDGAVWAGTANGLTRIAGGRARSYQGGLLAGRFVSAIVEDDRGLIVALPWMGLFRFDAGTLTPFRLEGTERIETQYVYEALRLSDGGIALATTGGLAFLRDGRLRLYTRADGLPHDNVRSIHEGTDGSLWLASGTAGIARFQHGRFLVLDVDTGLHDDRVIRALDDRRGDLWMSCPRGIFRVSGEDIADFAAGRRAKVRSLVFGEADGMPTNECSFGAQPPGTRKRDGTIWFPTFRGVVAIDPAHLPRNDVPPPVLLEGLLANDRLQLPIEGMAVGPGVDRLEIRFNGLSLLAPERVRFKCFLEGFDSDWVDVGPRRVAYYTKVPPGNYRFLVTAANDDGVWNEQGASLAFTVKPRFHQTPLFAALVLAAAGLVAWGLYRFRLHQLHEKYGAVLHERARIAREMHDTFVQNLGGIALQLDSVKMQFHDLPAELRTKLEETGTMVRYSLAEAYRTIRDLRTPVLEDQDLPTAIARLVERAGKDLGASAQFLVVGTPRRLDPTIEFNVLRVAQEAVGNVVRHARPRSLAVALAFDDNRLTLVVDDDGCGFDSTRAFSLDEAHYGLIGMKERAESLRGRLLATSVVGHGTRISMEVPITAPDDALDAPPRGDESEASRGPHAAR